MKFIAEIGWNFVGDMNLAENMIFLRKSLAPDYAKVSSLESTILERWAMGRGWKRNI